MSDEVERLRAENAELRALMYETTIALRCVAAYLRGHCTEDVVATVIDAIKESLVTKRGGALN